MRSLRRAGAERLDRSGDLTRTVLRLVERRVGLTPSGLATLAAVVVGWVIGRAIGSQPMFLMVYGLFLLVAVSWVLGRRRLSLSAHRSDLPSRIREGQTVEVEVGLQARRRLTTTVIEEELSDPLGQPVRVAIPLLPAGEEVTHAYAFSPGRRGVYTVGPLVAEWSDPFGLTRRRQVVADAVPLIVHPSTESVHDRVVSREWEDPPIRPPISKPWPNGFEFYGIRDYASGDDPRRIVWRATARQLDASGNPRYLVRESEQGITDRVNIFLDTDAEHHSPGDPSETFESAVRAVASVATTHLKDGFSVNFDTNAERLAKGFRGERHRIPLLDLLAAVHCDGTHLDRALERLLTDPNRSAHNVVVTPHLDVGTATRLRLLLERGTSLLLVIVMWENTEPATLHRAGSLGCNVVEVTPNVPLNRLFQRVIGGARR